MKGYNQIMDIKEKLNEAMKEAMKSGDEVRRRMTRTVLAAIKQVEVDKRTTLDDTAVMALIQKEIKNCREAIEDAKKANRPEVITDREAEIKVLQVFLPEAMSADELRSIVQSAIAETGAAAPADMGKVMKVVVPRVAGRAPNEMISTTVKELLTK
jgi:uncharacterized protein